MNLEAKRDKVVYKIGEREEELHPWYHLNIFDCPRCKKRYVFRKILIDNPHCCEIKTIAVCYSCGWSKEEIIKTDLRGTRGEAKI